MVESEFVGVTADMGTPSGGRFDWGFWFSGCWLELSRKRDVGLFCIYRAMGDCTKLDASFSPSMLGIRCDQ